MKNNLTKDSRLCFELDTHGKGPEITKQIDSIHH